MVPPKSDNANARPFQFSLRALVYFVGFAAVVCLCLRVSVETTMVALGILSVAVLFEVVLFSVMVRLIGFQSGGAELAAIMTALVTIIVPLVLCLACTVHTLLAP
jgi:hypothetical protein